MSTIQLVCSKINYGIKPTSIGLVFPNHNQEEIKQIYDDFYNNSYDKNIRRIFSKTDLEQNKISIEEFDKAVKQIYSQRPYFFDIFPADRSAQKEYLSAMEFFVPYGRDESTLEEITNQFVSYLWNNKIPVAQHLAVTLDDQTIYALENMQTRIKEQED